MVSPYKCENCGTRGNDWDSRFCEECWDKRFNQGVQAAIRVIRSASDAYAETGLNTYSEILLDVLGDVKSKIKE